MQGLLFVAAVSAALASPSGGASFHCSAGGTIPHSNRTAPAAACTGAEGDECQYACDPGYLAIGRHVCQSYSTMGVRVIDEAFFGGRCDRLCGSTAADWSCADGTRASTSFWTISPVFLSLYCECLLV